MQFQLSIEGSLEIRKALQDLGAKAPLAVAAALTDEANDLINDSKQLVPVDTGSLRNSAHVEPPVPSGTTIEVVAGFGGAAAPYAEAVHENPRSGKTSGYAPYDASRHSNDESQNMLRPRRYKHWAQIGQWKYLETPFKARTAGFLERMARRIRDNGLFR